MDLQGVLAANFCSGTEAAHSLARSFIIRSLYKSPSIVHEIEREYHETFSE